MWSELSRAMIQVPQQPRSSHITCALDTVWPKVRTSVNTAVTLTLCGQCVQSTLNSWKCAESTWQQQSHSYLCGTLCTWYNSTVLLLLLLQLLLCAAEDTSIISKAVTLILRGQYGEHSWQ